MGTMTRNDHALSGVGPSPSRLSTIGALSASPRASVDKPNDLSFLRIWLSQWHPSGSPNTTLGSGDASIVCQAAVASAARGMSSR